MRRRLALWYAIVTAILLIVFATGFYLYVQSTLIDRIDDTIDHVAEVIERSLIRSNLIDLESDFDRNFWVNAQAIDADHIDIDWFSPSGAILWTTGDETDSLQPREKGILKPIYRTVHLSEAEPLRQMTEPIVINGQLLGYLRISHPWFEVTKPVKQLFLDLAIGTTIMVFVVLLCGWWLAGLAMEPARESYQRLKQFTADASHELRNPIAVIQTNVQVALADPNPDLDFQRSQLETIERITRRLGRLIEDLLFLARHDHSDLTRQGRETCNLSQILHEVIQEQTTIAQQKQIVLELFKSDQKLDQKPDQTLLVLGDRDRLGRLFTNLVSNAIAYTPSGGKVQIVTQSNSQNQIQVQIKDTGIGIPEAELSQIFERFYRYQPKKSNKSHSKSSYLSTSESGLGLAIAKAIAESHQGQINVKSEVGEGTTFTVIFNI
jgi:OmpR-family two-component system manganese-sensing sensor histidine kinase